MPFSKIISQISQAVSQFQRTIPDSQRQVLQEVLDRLHNLDLDSTGNIKSTVANIKLVGSLRNKLLGIILNDDYIDDVKKYVDAFRDVTTLQNDYWKSIEPKFKPRVILKEIRTQTVEDTVNKLTEAGIGTNIADAITDVLRTSVTSGGTFRQLEQQLRDTIMNNRTGDGLLEKYTKQITTDALNQYSANYTKTVSEDLGAEWYQFQGSEIKTTRPICQAMHESVQYFHISQVPNLLKGLDAMGNRLEYSDINTGEIKKVEIYDRYGLPEGMYKGTDPSNYFTYRNGYNCGHQFRPVLREKTVPLAFRETVYATPQYQAWKDQRQ